MAANANAPNNNNNKPKPKPQNPMRDFIVDFLLGGLSAAISKTLAAPAERIKLLLQHEVRLQYRASELILFLVSNLTYQPPQVINTT